MKSLRRIPPAFDVDRFKRLSDEIWTLRPRFKQRAPDQGGEIRCGRKYNWKAFLRLYVADDVYPFELGACKMRVGLVQQF